MSYLTNEYHYIPLYIMLNFAQKGAGYKGGKAHEQMTFEALELAKNKRCRVPARLQSMRDSFLDQAKNLTGSQAHERVDLLKDPALAPRLRWLRNHYLHRSARTVTEMLAYVGIEAARDNTRIIIRDDVPSRSRVGAPSRKRAR